MNWLLQAPRQRDVPFIDEIQGSISQESCNQSSSDRFSLEKISGTLLLLLIVLQFGTNNKLNEFTRSCPRD